MPDVYEQFLTLLYERNTVINLTAVRREEAAVRHIEDALALLRFEAFAGRRVLDLGSGCGVPGMVLAIAVPSVQITLLDATGKKVAFLRETAQVLGLDNVECVHARAEEYAHGAARESFDIVTARGVASLPVLCETALPLLKIGGVLLAMKSDGGETAPVEPWGGAPPETHFYTLSDGREHAVRAVRKLAQTPAQYPRAWGKMTQRKD